MVDGGPGDALARHAAGVREDRKALGSYYTPAALVEAALGVSARGRRRGVVDLACGEGAWLRRRRAALAWDAR